MHETVREVNAVAGVLDQYGPVIGVLSVFLLIFICVIFYLVKSHQKTVEKLMTDNETLVKNITSSNKRMLENVLKETVQQQAPVQVELTPHIEKKLMSTFMRMNESLKDRCKNYLEKTTADRTAIYLFHNGTYTSHGFPFFKFSCICEQISKGSFSRMKEHHEFPVNLMGDIVGLLMEKGGYAEFGEITKGSKPIDPVIYKLLTKESNGFILCSIFDSCNNIMGFVLAEFSRSNLSETNIKKRTSALDDMAASVSPILEFSDANNQYKGGPV